MAKKKKELDRRVFKKEGEELQQWLNFRKRGSKVESGKKYNRQKFKRGEWEMIRCPNCGNTAQVRHLCGGAYLCGCGQMFYVENQQIKTASQICEEYEKANKKDLTNDRVRAIMKKRKEREWYYEDSKNLPL